jgi:hypothetical protein
VIGQGLAIGLLAGFRGVAADFLWIQAHTCRERRDWLRQYRNMELATTLQPRSGMFWETGAWHMAWNIGYAVGVDPAHRTQAEALKQQQLWHERARQFLLRGIENIPNRYDLYFALGWLYQNKFHDDCRATDAYSRAAACPDAPPYVARLHAYALAKCGMLGEAYEYWRSVWQQDHATAQQPWEVVAREIKLLEEQLNIPGEKRIFPATAAK